MSETVSTLRQQSGPAVTRLAHPLAFARFLKHIGGPAEQIFRRAGLPVLSQDPNVFVPVPFAWSAFDLAAKAEDRDIAWHVGQYIHENQLNEGLLQRISFAQTLYLGLKEFVRLASSEASDLRLGILEKDEDILLYAHYPGFEGRPGYAGSQGYQIPIYISVIRLYLGPNWFPEEIGIEARVVPDAARRMFPETRIRAGSPFGYIRIPRRLLSTPPPRQHGLSDALPIVLSKRFDYLDMLRALLLPYLGEGYPDSRLAATLMGTSQRTLFRRLVDSGLTYRELVDEIRFDKAASELRESTMSIGQVAAAVGFDNQTHFTRMFRRVGGMTPSAYRRACQE